MKKQILIGIITSIIFTILIQPILGTVWELINLTFSSFTNFLYKSAALGDRNQVDFMFFNFAIVLVVVFSIDTLIKIHRKSKDILSDAVKEDEQPDKKTLKKEIKELKKRTKKRLIRVYILAPLLVLLSIVMLIYQYADLQLNTSFNQRLNALSPYIDEHQEKIFRSKWALMTTKDDFIDINNKMEKLAKINSITLPPNLLD